MRWFRLAATLLVAGLPALLAPCRAGAASATTARLLLPVETVRPGDSFVAAVELTMKPGWHTYWRNGGDSGAPTTLDWTLPPGLEAGEIRWPAPERLEEAGLVTFIHHGTIQLLVPFKVAADAAPGPRELSASVVWLECEKLCLRGTGTVRGRLTVAAETKPSADAARIGEGERRLPPPLPDGTASAVWDGPAAGDQRTVVLRWQVPAGSPDGTPDFFPDSAETHSVETATDRLPPADGAVLLRKKVKRLGDAWPTHLTGVFVVLNARMKPAAAFEARLPVTDLPAAGAAAPSPARGPGAPANPAGPGRVSGASLGLPQAVGLAFVGGLILNIMPCVLPVIALKILGFVRQSGSRPAEIRRLGVVYGIGVWFSFLVLAGAVIGVKRAAGAASWGMQFGNPVFLVGLTSLVTLVALSLFGVFEINVTGRALDAAGDLASKEGPAGAFFNGMLAVALATPCTAPFLAPALGYAFAADPLTILLIFSAVAWGLASPYVVLSCQPAWLKFLPKPGAWMERFKVAMGFPMLATAIWLYSLAAAHFGPAGALWLGLFLVGLALAAWVWGEFAQRGRARPGLARAVAAAILATAYVVVLERELDWRSPRDTAADTPSAAARPGHIPWKPWSREAVDAARQEGRPVLVDFTADWCLTCRVNERSSLEIPEVREQLKILGVVPLKGDHTRLPPAITEELQRFGRAGVPLVLVYPKDASREPMILPEVLTPGIVLDALRQAAGP